MRKFLAISIALLLAVIVLTPAMGYTIKSENSSYSIKSGEKVNYSISMGTPAHEITSMPVAAKASPRYSISSESVAYSFKSEAVPKYSISTGAATTTEAAQTTATTKATPVTTAAKALASNSTAPAAAANITKPANTAKAVNTTAAVTKLSISGAAFEEIDNNTVKEANEQGIAGVKVDLAQPADTIIANTTTSETGDYSFKNLMPGEYTVTVSAPEDMKVVSPASGKYTVMLAAKNEANKDFGFASTVKSNATSVGNATLAATLDKAATTDAASAQSATSAPPAVASTASK